MDALDSSISYFGEKCYEEREGLGEIRNERKRKYRMKKGKKDV